MAKKEIILKETSKIVRFNGVKKSVELIEARYKASCGHISICSYIVDTPKDERVKFVKRMMKIPCNKCLFKGKI